MRIVLPMNLGNIFALWCAFSFDTGMRAAQSVVQFGLRLHPCSKDKRQQPHLSTMEHTSRERERLQQQHRNRRKGRKEVSDAADAKARMAAARAEIEQAKTKYCGDGCCPPLDCLDRQVVFLLYFVCTSIYKEASTVV